MKEMEIEVGAAGRQEEAKKILAAGDAFFKLKQFKNAQECYMKSIALMPHSAIAYNNLGKVLEVQGNADEAIGCYKQSLANDGTLTIARRNLAVLLVRNFRDGESIDLWEVEIRSGDPGISWINKLITHAFANKKFEFAGRVSKILCLLRWGSKWTCFDGKIPEKAPLTILTIPKLQHDIDQFRYLMGKSILSDEFVPIIESYENVIRTLRTKGENTRVAMDGETEKEIGHVYNRVINIKETPRVERALSPTWNANEVELNYKKNKLGLVVIDNFLTATALEKVREFCVESTVWTSNKYEFARFGAFFNDGFNNPLLLQIAQELQEALPGIITPKYPLKQIWGFKNGGYLPPDSTIHADFAAINGNFWITPEDANLNKDTGGLIVYSVDAPLGWDFHTYNGRSDIIKKFLLEQNARAIRIPYKQNRAIIFNSDLFHNTDEVDFKTEHENRRINITMLFGDREKDEHHRNLAQYPELNKSGNNLGIGRLGFSSKRR